MYAVFLAASISYGPTDDVSAAIAIALAMAQRKPSKAEIEPIDEPKQTWPTYTEARKKAATTGSVMLIFVGVEPRLIPRVDAIVAYSGKLTGYDSPCVVVSKQGGEYWFATLPGDASDFDIARTVGIANERQVSQRAVPFLRPGEVPVADGSEDVSGRLTFLRDLVPYTTARNTQITFRRWSGYIGPSPRSSLENHWQVPGGLDGVRGWSSQLLKSRNAVANVFLVRQDPSDVNSAITWGRSYPDGSVFADVIRNERGDVVEVRVAEKHDGVWDRHVVFRDHAKAPAGFRRFKSKQCSECHNQAGVSAYGGAAIPGADTIISDPIDVIERGQTVQGGFGTSLGR